MCTAFTIGVSTGPGATALTLICSARGRWPALRGDDPPFEAVGAPSAAAQARPSDVDDGAAAAVLHEARRRPGDDEGADDVDIEDLAQEGDRRLQRVDVGGDPGRVDDAVEAAECLARHGHRLLGGRLVGDIERRGEDARG